MQCLIILKKKIQISLVLAFVFLMVLPSIQIGAANALVYRSTASSSGNWTMFTENYNNSRYVPNSQVTSSNVANLRVAWQSDKTGQVTGQPMVSNGIVYFGDW